MRIHRSKMLLSVACAALLLTAGSGARVSMAQGPDRPVLSGQATALQAKVLGIQLEPIGDTGYFEAESFTPQPTCLLREDIEGLPLPAELSVSAEFLCGSTRGQGDRSASEAHVAALEANVAGVPVTAALLRSETTAECSALAPVLGGQAQVLQARVGSVTIDADPFLPTPRNEPVPIPGVPGAYFIIAERSTQYNGNHGAITLTALRVFVPGLLPNTDTDVSFARAHADIKCQGQPACPAPSFVTGGGFLSGKRHFVIAFRDGDPGWGHMMYSHQATGVRIRADRPFTSAKLYPAGKEGGGTVTGNSNVGPFTASIVDNGEPGREDWFSLDGVAAGNLEGGNLQVHRPCKGSK
jgi:hypothetical protein